MSKSIRIAAVAAAMSLFLSLAVPVQAGTSQQIFLPEGAMLGETPLEQGFYKLLYKKNGSKDTFIVSLHRGGKVIAKADGVRERRDERQTGGISFRAGMNGTQQLAEIRIGGTKTVIVISG